MLFIQHWHVALILDRDKNHRRTLSPLSPGYRTRPTASLHRKDYPGLNTGIVRCFGCCELAFVPRPRDWMDSDATHLELNMKSEFY